MKIYFSPDYSQGGIIGPDIPPPPPRGKVISNNGYFPSSSQGDTARQLDVRDIIASFINRKDKNLSDDQSKKDFRVMSNILGDDLARKTFNHIIIFNQRADQQNQPFEKRLSSLYTIGSNDKDVDNLLKRTGALGQGPIAGAKDSQNLAVMSAYGPTIAPPISMATAMINRK